MVKFANVKHFLMQQLAEQQEERQLTAVLQHPLNVGSHKGHLQA